MTENTGRGKWTVPEVPHKGWTCVHFEDLDTPAETCEMCESAEIRYVHVMQHPEYPDTLRCGRICAGHMAEDYAAAEERERKAQNRATRRQNWLTRNWRISGKGNWFLNTDGFNIVVYPEGQWWKARITHRETGRGFWSKRTYHSADACKLATLDALLFIKAHQDELI